MLPRQAVESDYPWVNKVAKEVSYIIGGNIFFILKKLLKKEVKNEFLIVAPELGFIHYKTYPKYNKVIDFGVSAAARRTGVGKALWDYVKKPILVETDDGAAESNSFYLKQGCELYGQRLSRKGKLINIYLCAR